MQEEDQAASAAAAWMQAHYQEFEAGLTPAGWQLSRIYLGPLRHTADWSHKHAD